MPRKSVETLNPLRESRTGRGATRSSGSTPPWAGAHGPRIDDEVAVGEAEHRVEVELGDFRQVLAQLREPTQQIGERTAVSRGAAAEATDETTGLAAVDELQSTRVGDRGQAESRLADQLGQDAARAERHERPEYGILDDPGEQFDATLRSSAGRRAALLFARPRVAPRRGR